MANKLYEENSIADIAEKIRLFSNNKSKTYTVSQMANGVEGACQDQYENGRDSGFDAGREYVKTTEARTASDVYTPVEVDARSVEVTVTQGYYATEVVKNVDVQDVYDAGHTEGYTEGYEEGLAAGGGGGDGSSDVDEMMLLDEWHDWEGEPPFYSYHKYLDYEISSLSSTPVIVSLGNNHEHKYLHVYVYAYINGNAVGLEDEERYYTVVLPPADEAHDWYGFNSLEIEVPCYDVRIWGIRWSDDGV